ncbi:MAG: response regulator [Zetaproteobacteria bacterium CG_4_10_14_0_2_um_filter_55_20]|nr:MAG: response regulator [Zetaproteobacteria bacterium CG08_land_8_20_14_0_20_55_17]PIZ40150.1 MAG: response regulator [Zetaproteobacteria bacterium CG_4_10_14_0_2_um_filter_55_20]PJB82154.1 MAG: response regulator [Zetaproteobacteria bacterium CG_4_9_14_0_8_um_filter_55_31]
MTDSIEFSVLEERLGEMQAVGGAAGGTGMRALVVEDDVVVQGVLKAYLKHYGVDYGNPMEIWALSDARKALALLTAEEDVCDVVFLNVHLSQLGDDEIYKQLMQVNSKMFGRIVFVTAYRDDLVARFPEHKLNVLDKPFRYSQLLGAMAAVVV